MPLRFNYGVEFQPETQWRNPWPLIETLQTLVSGNLYKEKKRNGTFSFTLASHCLAGGSVFGGFLGILSRESSVSKSIWWHVDIVRFSIINLMYTLKIHLNGLVIFLQSWTSTGYFSNSGSSPCSLMKIDGRQSQLPVAASCSFLEMQWSVRSQKGYGTKSTWRWCQTDWLVGSSRKVGPRVFHPGIILQVSEELLRSPESPYVRTDLRFIYVL